MKQSVIIVIFAIAAAFGCVFAQPFELDGSMDKSDHLRPIKIDEFMQDDQDDDPFEHKTAQSAKKKNSKRQNPTDLPTDQEREQIYRSGKHDKKNNGKIKSRSQDGDYYADFNTLLKWGMIAGSGFLVFVLLKICMRKNGRRQQRRIRRQNAIRNQVAPVEQQMVYFYPTQDQALHRPINLNKNQSQSHQSIDQKIISAERQLNRLKKMKQEALKKQFNTKKIQEQQTRRIEMINIQRKQAFEQSRRNQNNWNTGYGPVFHGQQMVNYDRVYYEQAPFQVKGVEPIRPRQNSFKTETSERPILNNQINYRNGIPIGKPIRQKDNDSSFASEYPQV